VNIKERLDNLRLHIQQSGFLEGKGLSNEVNIRIFCYKPEEEMIVQYFVEQIKNDSSLSCNIIECNLYKTFLSVCEDIDILDAITEMEEMDGKEFLLEQLHSAISSGEYVEKANYSPHKLGDILLITGVGDVFPFMRVHALLEAMQPYFSDIPILVMYPGTFDGNYVRLFDRLTPNPYYRALTKSKEAHS